MHMKLARSLGAGNLNTSQPRPKAVFGLTLPGPTPLPSCVSAHPHPLLFGFIHHSEELGFNGVPWQSLGLEEMGECTPPKKYYTGHRFADSRIGPSSN